MLGDVIYEEKGQTTGIRVLSSENGFAKLEVSLQTEGTIRGVGQKCFWTYISEIRPDGSVHGGGKGVMTTADGDVINLEGSAAGKAAADGSIAYRGSLYFHTLSPKYADLNTIAGVFEYDVDGDGKTAAKIWEWK